MAHLKIGEFVFFIFILFKSSYSAQKKNVVVIVADDLGWNDVSFHGSNQFLTPNIDILAYSGVILQNYYVMPVCSPSRSALMTGIHPIHTGMYKNVVHYGHPFGLPLDVKILPQYLKELGYTTRAVGKWHLGFHKRVYTPVYRGFDSHFGYWGGKEDYYTHTAYDNLAIIGRDFRINMNTTWNYNGQYSTDLFTEESIRIINSHNTSAPLFLYLAHQATHVGNKLDPLQAPPEIIEKFNYIEDEKRRIFAAMAWKLDESVGKVVQALASRNMLNDTIIIFTTDNGGPAGGMEGNCASNWPLRGTKATSWEGGVHGVSFVWSSDLPHSRISNALMHIQDWLPTILGAIDENMVNNATLMKGLDGQNMWPVLKGDKDSEYDELIIQRNFIGNGGTLRKNNWKIIAGGHRNSPRNKWFGPSGRGNNTRYNITEIHLSTAAVALSQSHLKLPSNQEIINIRTNITLSCDYCGNNGTNNCTQCVASEDEMCLFDISKDPCELNNVAKKYPNVLTSLMKIMTKYIPVPPRDKPFDFRSNPNFWNKTWTNWKDYVDKKSEHWVSQSIHYLELPRSNNSVQSFERTGNLNRHFVQFLRINETNHADWPNSV